MRSVIIYNIVEHYDLCKEKNVCYCRAVMLTCSKLYNCSAKGQLLFIRVCWVFSRIQLIIKLTLMFPHKLSTNSKLFRFWTAALQLLWLFQQICFLCFFIDLTWSSYRLLHLQVRRLCVNECEEGLASCLCVTHVTLKINNVN